MTTYCCSGCGMRQTALNDLHGKAHVQTGGKPSGCAGRWVRLEGAEGEVMLFESA